VFLAKGAAPVSGWRIIRSDSLSKRTKDVPPAGRKEIKAVASKLFSS